MATYLTTSATPMKPLILIVGATGTGKSDLAIKIAQAFNQLHHPIYSPPSKSYAGAEIINADAMQLYRGLPIITNKVTTTEQCGVPHHLLDYIGLEAQPWTVHQYVREADILIEKVRQRGNIPIVVGGTSYYIHGLLFRDALLEAQKQYQTQAAEDCENGEAKMGEQDAAFGKDAALTWPILAADTATIYAKLQDVDPEIAKRWHPNDRRKIQRSLEIYLRSGRKASEVYDEQKRSGATAAPQRELPESLAESYLRYDPIIFWLEAESEVLRDRLNQRVDIMVEKGLLTEAKEMDLALQQIKEKMVPLDKTKGIWVSIGYKEMEPWIEACRTKALNEKDLCNLKDDCIEAVKASTRQYAKSQNRFIRLRLANALAKAKAHRNLFLLDCTDIGRWQEIVLDPALGVLRAFLRGEQLPEPSSLSQFASQIFASMTPEEEVAQRVARKCETCDKVLMTEAEWTKHLNSRSHQKVLQAIRKRELNEARKRAAHDVKLALDETNPLPATRTHDH